MQIHRVSKLQEYKISEYLGWAQVPASGSRPFNPGDIVTDHWLGECKTHIAYGCDVIFRGSVWNKIEREAMSTFKYPILFADTGWANLAETWCVVPSKMVNSARYIGVPEDHADRWKASIRFAHEQLGTYYLEKNREYGNHPVVVSKLGSSNVAILPILYFKDFLASGNIL